MSTYSFKKAWLYLRRSARLRCPVCGISPLFPPAHKVEGLEDWFTTLPGCPRCGFAYEREPGYFLLPIGLVNFGVVMICGTSFALALDSFFEPSTASLIFLTLVLTWGISILCVRHAKAFFLALDHFVDPCIDESE